MLSDDRSTVANNLEPGSLLGFARGDIQRHRYCTQLPKRQEIEQKLGRTNAGRQYNARSDPDSMRREHATPPFDEV